MTSPAWRTVVMREGYHLTYREGQMVVRVKGGMEESFPLFDVRAVVITSLQCSLTSHLIYELRSRQIRLIFCDSQKIPHGEVVGYHTHHAVPERLKEQIQWEKGHRTELRIRDSLFVGNSLFDNSWIPYQFRDSSL